MSTLSFVRFSLISIFAWLQFVVAHPVLRDVGSLGPFANRGEGKFVLAHMFSLDGSTEEFLHQNVPTVFSALAIWGTGKYTLDLDVYHRQVKPIFIKRFQGAFSDFTSKCGTNPDFEIDRKGIVNPNAVKGKDLCTKKRFSLDLGDVVLAHQLISDNEDDNSAVDFSGPAVQNLLEVLATWGTGKYTLDLDVYHRQVKPIFIKRFQAAFKDFTSKCGTNPDFEIDRKGIVNPNAVKGKDICTKKRFNLDLGDVVLAHQLIPDNEDGDSEVEFFDKNVPSLFNVLATWGTGRTLDLDVHQTTRFNSALDRASAWILSAWI